MTPNPYSASKRFRVALSFPNEIRRFVSGIAKHLGHVLGQTAVFYDANYKSELCRPNMDLYLQEIYRDQSDLVVPIFCAEYEKKKWCNVEWRVIRTILMDRSRDDCIMAIRRDSAPIPGFLEVDGYIDAKSLTSRKVADLILERVLGKPKNSTPNIIDNYKRDISREWQSRWSVDADINALSDLPPFIYDQGLRLLNRRKVHSLPRYAINTAFYRRVRHEDERRETRLPEEKRRRSKRSSEINNAADIRNEETWLAQSRESLATDILNRSSMKHLHRLVVATDAGMGKTTNLQWLHAAINAIDGQHVAFLMNVSELPTALCDSLDQLIAKLMLQVASNGLLDLAMDHVVRLVRNRREAGAIVLLVDALDQVDLASTASLRSLRYLLADQGWKDCPIVLGSRPFALQRDWKSLFGDDRALGWAFLQVDEFNSAQQQRYLGVDRYQWIPPEAREILGVPRVLYYLRSTSDDDFREIERASDVYWLSTSRLLEEGLQSREAHELSPDTARFLLSAVAFEMSVCRRNFDQIDEDAMLRFLTDVSTRCRTYDPQFGVEWVQKTLRQISSMNEFLSYAVLEAGFPRQIQWRNRSLQEFFAGLWLSKFASNSDLALLHEAIFSPADFYDSDYYWIFRFAVEMPRVARAMDRWLPLVSPLFDRKRSHIAAKPRPTEFIFRAWTIFEEYLTDASQKGELNEPINEAINAFAVFRAEFFKIKLGHRGTKQRRIANQLLTEFKRIPPIACHDGVDRTEFWMGSPIGEVGRGDNEPLHRRAVPPAFEIACLPVTAEQYELFDANHGGRSDRRWKPRNPALHVTWYDAWVFSRWLGEGFRLPSEVEWEFACRAGTTTTYSFGNQGHDLRRYARCGVHGTFFPNPVGCLIPNPWGLFDMHGNCWEWCDDWYVKEPTKANSAANERAFKVVRGGSHNTSRYRIRSAERGFRVPDEKGATGFRIVKDIAIEI